MPITVYRPAQQLTYGRPEYRGAISDWERTQRDYAGLMRGVTPALGQMMGYYAPGGGWGRGRRQEARETVGGGLAKDIGSMVATGMSSQFGARGAQTRAGSELARLYGNIEDTRAQLWQQSVMPYAQIMAQMANMMRARPTYGQYFRPGAAFPESRQTF